MRFLVDEMFPRAVCALLADAGRDAWHVRDIGLTASPDAEVAEAARRDGRVLVTENVKDFAAEPDLVIVCVLKSRLGVGGGGLHRRLADVLVKWARAEPEPYVGLHRPA